MSAAFTCNGVPYGKNVGQHGLWHHGWVEREKVSALQLSFDKTAPSPD